MALATNCTPAEGDPLRHVEDVHQHRQDGELDAVATSDAIEDLVSARAWRGRRH